MTTLVVNARADRDVEEIFETIRQAKGATVAAGYNRSFDALFVRLMSFPESGPLRPGLGPGIRIGVVHPYVLVYKFDAAKDTVEVLRVLHGRRDIGPRVLLP